MSPMAIAALEVVEVRSVGPGVVETFLAAAELARDVTPGQFVMLRWRDALDPLLPRPMSVYRVSEVSGRRCVSVVYTVGGPGTARLAAARPGDKLAVLGPLGHGFDLSQPPRQALLVAGGIGIAGLGLLAHELKRRAIPTTLAYGARSARDLVLLEEFAAVGCKLRVATDDGSRGVKGFVTAEVEAMASAGELAGAEVYACGPTPMLRSLDAVLKRHPLPAQLALEARMGCGFGICLGCAVPAADKPGTYHLVCKDGPVMRPDQVML